MWPENCPAPYLKYQSSRRNSESSDEAMATKDPDLEELPELRPEVTCFLRGSAKNSEEEEKAPSPEPRVKELCKWVAWKAEACKTPGWWRELLAVPEVQDCEKLAQKVWALFPPKGQVSYTRWRITIRCHLHHCVSSERISCHLPIPSSPPGTFKRCKGRRQWHMPKPSSIGWRRLICLLEGRHAC